MSIKNLFCVLFVAVFAFGARADFNAPDFAYPQTVMNDAEEVLHTSSNGLKRLKAVMEIVKAKTEIDPDSIDSMYAFIGEWGEKEDDAAVKALFKLYQAQVAQMGSRKVQPMAAELALEALNDVKMWGSRPLSDFSEVIELPNEWKTFSPRIRDFAFAKAITLCPDEAERLLEMAVGESTEGTPEWAVWICEKNRSYKELLELYNIYNKGVTGAYLLSKMCLMCNDNTLDCVALLNDYLAKNTENILTSALKQSLAHFTAPSMAVNVPGVVMPGKEFDVTFTYGYISEVGIEVYKVDDIRNYKSNKTKVAEYRLDTNHKAVNDSSVIKISIPRPGNYEIVGVSKDIKTAKYISSSQLTVTEWIPFAVVNGDEAVVGVADFASGKAVGGVNTVLSNNNAKEASLCSTTKSDGFASLSFANKKGTSKGGYISLVKGGSKVQFDEGLWNYSREQSGVSRQGAVFVSRPLYHFGDTIGWTAVIAEKDLGKYSSRLMAGKNISAVLRDANYQPLDTVSCTTDDFGRASGSFVLPAEGLAGNFHINILYNNEYLCSGGVTVSDFKLPVFEITGLKVAQIDSMYVVEGRAVRYSGAAVPDAAVEVKLRKAPLWLRWASDDFSYPSELKAEGKTRADGSFTVKIPAVPSVPAVGINYICEATVTSVNADFAEASTTFRVGKPYLLGCDGGISEINAAQPVNMHITTIGTDLKFSPLELKWILIKDSREVYSGICRTDSLGTALDFSNVAAGKYNIKLMPDTTVCNSLELGPVWIYNTERNEIPADLRLVVPTKVYENVEGNYVDILVGTGSESYVYIFGFSTDGKLQPDVKKMSEGFHTLSVPIDRRDEQEIEIFTVYEGVTHHCTVKVKRPLPDTSLKLYGESWRDRLTPGMGEKWKLKLSDMSGKGVEGALIASLFNSALNSLSQSQWPSLRGVLSAPMKLVRHQFTLPYFSSGTIMLKDFRPIGFPGLEVPSFLYTPKIFSTMAYPVERMMMKSRATASNAAMAAADLAVEEESAMDADTGGAAPSEGKADFDYRDAETLQAFWMPSLTTDKDGNAFIEFTMPNAIGSWDFRASAWTKDMRTASMFATLISSKPVMVEPSLPRFLRQGDKAKVGATVINNSDSAAMITTFVEIFTPNDGKIINSTTFANHINAKGQFVVYVDIDAEIGLESVGYRVRSGNGTFYDGEQSVIPVLEASTVAIDSDLFYLDENKTTFTTTIPADKSGEGIVAVEYCQNPVWDVVKSLPALYESEPSTALAAASSAYAALTALDLYRKFPEIKRVLDIWESNPSDSSLVSDLYKNEDLKLAALAQTPFVGAANANNERMARLALTFDKKVIDKVLREAVGKLEALQKAGGGFSWGSWTDEESEWMTMQVLNTLAMLQNTKIIEENSRLKAIVDKAFTFVDNSVKPKAPNLSYALLYSRFTDRKPSTLAGMGSIDATVQNILSTWKQHSTSLKASDALVLNAFGNKSMASEVMRSISQFAMNSPRLGVVFPSVNSVDSYVSLITAFDTIEPQSKLLDGMRKWLVLRTQANDDLGAWNPSALVSAILSTGSNWIANPSASTANVSVDGRPLAVSKVEAATGSFSKRLEPSSSVRAITFVCPENTPAAYGSVTTVSTIPLESVAPRSVDGLSVTKRIMAWRGGQWVESKEFVLGERVMVEMNVEVKNGMEYVMLSDQRPAGFEPASQMPGWINTRDVFAYRQITDTSCQLFIRRMEKANYTFQYEAVAAYAGTFVSGVATIQSQYAPELTARSGANHIIIKDSKAFTE